MPPSKSTKSEPAGKPVEFVRERIRKTAIDRIDALCFKAGLEKQGDRIRARYRRAKTSPKREKLARETYRRLVEAVKGARALLQSLDERNGLTVWELHLRLVFDSLESSVRGKGTIDRLVSGLASKNVARRRGPEDWTELRRLIVMVRAEGVPWRSEGKPENADFAYLFLIVSDDASIGSGEDFATVYGRVFDRVEKEIPRLETEVKQWAPSGPRTAAKSPEQQEAEEAERVFARDGDNPVASMSPLHEGTVPTASRSWERPSSTRTPSEDSPSKPPVTRARSKPRSLVAPPSSRQRR